MKVLLDEMFHGLEPLLSKKGYTVDTVGKLKREDERLGNDFNIIGQTRDKGFVLVTGDRENGKACKANGIPCVFVSLEVICEKIVLPELRRLEPT